LILKNKKGETLMELIASMLVFTVLIASITTMIIVSLRISANATTRSEEFQQEANEVLAGAPAHLNNTGGTVSFTLITDDTDYKTVDILVAVYDSDNFQSFIP